MKRRRAVTPVSTEKVPKDFDSEESLSLICLRQVSYGGPLLISVPK